MAKLRNGLMLILGVFAIAILGMGLASDEVDDLCSISGSLLYRNDTTWTCGQLNNLVTIENVTIITNITQYQINTTNAAIDNILTNVNFTYHNQTDTCFNNGVYWNTSVSGTTATWTVVI